MTEVLIEVLGLRGLTGGGHPAGRVGSGSGRGESTGASQRYCSGLQLTLTPYIRTYMHIHAIYIRTYVYVYVYMYVLYVYYGRVKQFVLA